MIEKTSDAPAGWEIVALADVTAASTEKAEPSEFKDSQYIGLEHIEGGTKQILGTGDASSVKSTKSVFRSGDVLYGKLRPYLNKVCKPEFDGVCSTDILVYPQHSNLESGYLLHFLSRPSTAEYATQNASGINLPRISATTLGEIEFPLAPLAEQRRIVAKIEALQERSRKARQALAEVGPLLEQFRQSLLVAAFRGDLTADWRAAHPNIDPAIELRGVEASVSRKKAEIAQGHDTVREIASRDWPIAKLGSIFSLIDYRGKNPQKADSGRRLITAKNIRMGYLQDEPIEFVSENEYTSWMTRGFPQKGDILFVTEGHTMGFVALNDRDDEFALAQRTITLHPPIGVDSRCFFYFLMSPILQSLVNLNATGSAAKGIKGAKFRDFPIPFPSYAEQVEIARRVEGMFRFIDSVESGLRQAESDILQLDHTILAKAFRGELVPQGPKDEPASTLLDRIHEARKSSAPARRNLRRHEIER